MAIKSIIASLIESQGYSQKAFSKKADLPYSTLRSVLQRGLANSGVDNAIKISAALGMPLEELYAIEKDLEKPNLAASAFSKIPLLGYVPAGSPTITEENVIDYVSAPRDQVADGDYFYLEVKGDSMTGANIYPGYRVLVRQQPDVESGDIAVVQVNEHEATLKRVRKEDGMVRLIAENPLYPTQVINSNEARIIGKVVKVEFDPS